MGYSKIISYGKTLEIYEYEENIRTLGRKKTAFRNSDSDEVLADDGKVVVPEKQAKQIDQARRKDNVRRAQMAFRRLVLANLGESINPVFASLTYAENMQDVRQGHNDFNAFAKLLRSQYGQDVRYIAVSEFQKRGALHFHALIWGIPFDVVRGERTTRFLAGLWQQGFIDLVETDGNDAIAGYMAKYMGKSFTDSLSNFSKSYIASRNIKRPIVDKGGIVESYFYDELSTPVLLQQKEYMTKWLGKGRYSLYKIKIKTNEE